MRFWKKKKTVIDEQKSPSKNKGFSRKVVVEGNRSLLKVRSPFDGSVVLLENVPDKTFANKTLGDGVAIIPTSSTLVTPVSGKIVASFPTGHAFSIRTGNNYGILIHVGLGSSQGEGLNPKVSSGDQVSLESELCEVNLKSLKKNGISPITPVTLLTDPTYRHGKVNLKVGSGQKVKVGDILFEVSL